MRVSGNASSPAGKPRYGNDAWKVCQRLAGSHRGIVTHPQLVQAGIAPAQIQRWARRGMLVRLYQGVFAVGHAALPPLAKLQAALYACGSHALLSHSSALYLWGLRDRPPAAIDITVVGGHLRAKPGIHLHRLSRLDKHDVARREGLPVTSPARTIVDQAAYCTLDELERLVAEARVLKLLRAGDLEAAVKRAGNRTGVGRVRDFLRSEGEPVMTRSKGERLLRRLLRQAALPLPRVNCRVGGYEVDCFWEDQKLIVEFDGYQTHGHRRAFENDRRKDVILANAGYQVLRFTWRRLEREPIVVIAAIAQALGRRSLAAA